MANGIRAGVFTSPKAAFRFSPSGPLGSPDRLPFGDPAPGRPGFDPFGGPSPFGPDVPGSPGGVPNIPGTDIPIDVAADLSCRIFGLFCPKTPAPRGPGPTPFAPDVPGGCAPGFSRDPITGKCVFDIDPGPGTGFPGGDNGLTTPRQTCIETLVCPKFADNKKGVLWMSALTGTVVCLPRGVSGTGFGLVRKNRPRRKAFVTAAEMSALRGQARTKKKAKKFAGLTGQTCVARGARSNSRGR